MPIFTDEPTDLIPNTEPATVVKSVQIPVGGNLNAPKVPEPNKDADRTFRTQEELKTSLLFSSKGIVAILIISSLDTSISNFLSLFKR